MNRGMRLAAICSLPACSEIFTRRAVDLARAKTPFCSRRCGNMAKATGRASRIVPCEHCGAPVERLLSEAPRRKRVFCSRACFLAGDNMRAIGRLGGLAARPPEDPEARRRRAQLGGLARAARSSPERLREIGLQGVRARSRSDYLRGWLTRRAGADVVLGVRLGRRR